MEKQHRHLIIRARVNNPPTDENFVKQWMTNVVHSVGMNVMMGPISSYSNIKGNEGITCLVALDFSHAAIHIWDKYENPLIEFDLFSCKTFDINVVVDKFKEFGVNSLGLQYINRDNRYEGEFGKFDKIYVVYKTTNKLNQKYYYGVHGFTDIADKYIGSGKKLIRAIKKYGKENFICEHIKFFDDEEEAYEYEKKLVDSELLKDENCYNMAIGGKGCARNGGIYKKKNIRTKQKYNWITDGTQNKLVLRDNPIDKGWYKGRTINEISKQKLSIIRKGKPSHRKGKYISKDHKTKIKHTLIERYKKIPHHTKGKVKKI